MSTFEGSYESLLQGVSQQIARLRLPGQVSAAVNVLFDPVTNVRRRPGAQVLFNLPFAGEDSNSIKALETDIGGKRIQVILGVRTGHLKVLDSQYTELADLSSEYLRADNVRNIKLATVGDELFIANTEFQPEALPPPSGITPARQGFCFIVAGTFSKQYDVRVTTNLGSVSGTYTTPASTAANAAVNSLPETIAANLKTSLESNGVLATAGVTVYVAGAYLYFRGNGSVTSCVISTTSASVYLLASGASVVRLESNLPARLPDEANGYIVGVGQSKSLVYYKYDATNSRWLESGDWASPSGFSNMPISLKFDTTTSAWVLDESDFEGRLAGDDETNEIPPIETNGITGLGSYQGRLVLLSGWQVGLSGSNRPRRIMRSTVTALVDSDPVWIGATANSSAVYEYAVPFQKDLLLFSSNYQALIPGSNIAVTPRTATVLITSTFNADMQSSPVPIGRTLLFPAPLSEDFFGVMEMISSQYTDSQYISQHVTEHLPKYMAGTCRFSASSSVSSSVLFGQSLDTRGLIMYQYMWSGDEKVQQAWGRWNFEYPVATAYFQGESCTILSIQNGVLVGMRIDPKVGVVNRSNFRRPFLDYYVEVEVVDRQFQVPTWMLEFDPDIVPKLRLSQSEGPMAGERVGIESVDTVTGAGTTVRSFRNGSCMLGIRFSSLFSPTAPVLVDRMGTKIDSNKMTILRYGIATENSAEYEVAVFDANVMSSSEDMGTLFWSSDELELGSARVAMQSRAIVPARTNADTTSLQISTDGLGELNIVGLDYSCRYHQKIRRL